MIRSIGIIAAALSVLSATTSHAEGKAIDAFPFHEKLKIDGLLREWPAMVELSYGTGGTAAKGLVGYDDKNIYVAMSVNDRRLARSASYGSDEDVATLYLGFPGRGAKVTQYSVALFAGDPGRVAGAVRVNGKAVAGAKLVEAPTSQGYNFEASIPWAAFAEAARVRVGLSALLEYADRERVGGAASTVATSPSHAPSAMPALTLEGEYSLKQGLLGPKRQRDTPALAVLGDVAGDGYLERVAVYGRYLTIVGSNYRGGKEYFYQDLGVDSDVKRLELRDLTGDAKDEILIEKRVTSEGLERHIFQVLSVSRNSEDPFSAFQHELGLVSGSQKVTNKLRLDKAEAGKARIVIEQGEVSSELDPKLFETSGGGDLNPALMPWDDVQNRSFVWDGRKFAVADEQAAKSKRSHAKSAPSGRVEAPVEQAPPPPRPPSPDELMERVYALYRNEHQAGSSKARFDFATDVAADSQNERIVIHGKDIVAFGKGFQSGSSYVYLTIGVEEPADITAATALDITGDGKAEVMVFGVIRAKASKRLGGKVITRHALFIYQIQESGIKRIFSAETGRSLGEQVVLGKVNFTRSGKSSLIELGPGQALNWTQETYPFPPDRTPYGGLEPLLLPWTDLPARRYEYDGLEYVQKH